MLKLTKVEVNTKSVIEEHFTFFHVVNIFGAVNWFTQKFTFAIKMNNKKSKYRTKVKENNYKLISRVV